MHSLLNTTIVLKNKHNFSHENRHHTSTHPNPTNEESDYVREDDPALHQPLVPGEQHGVEHALVEEAVAHPLGHDHVHPAHVPWQLHLLHLVELSTNLREVSMPGGEGPFRSIQQSVLIKS